jgi:hypothetical protein
MKTQHFIYCIAIIAVSFTACKKDKNEDYWDKNEDYRANWVGSYDCEKNCLQGIYQTVVDVSMREDSMLYISEREIPQGHLGIRGLAKVDGDGFFYQFERAGGFSGNFIKDSLYSMCFVASPGGAFSRADYKGKTSKGEKKKKKD